jgi:hypothetical protein
MGTQCGEPRRHFIESNALRAMRCTPVNL